MSSRTFTVSPPDNLDAQLGFLARSIIVDNPTPCFWYCAGANVWILPYTFGAIIVLPSADETAKLTFAAPIGQVQPRPAAGSVTALSVTYYETVAGPASPGVNVPISQGRAPLSLTFAVTGTTQTFLVSSPILDGFTCRVESTGALSALTLAFSWTLPGGSPRSETYYATLGTATPIEFDIPGSFPPGTTFAVTATYAVAQTVIVWIIQVQHYTSVLPAGGTVTINAHHWDAMLLWVTNTSGGVNPVSVFGRVGTANLIQVVNGYNLAAAAPWPLMMFSKGGQPVSFATIPPAAGTIAAMLPLFDNLTITLTNAGTVNYAGWAA